LLVMLLSMGDVVDEGSEGGGGDDGSVWRVVCKVGGGERDVHA